MTTTPLWGAPIEVPGNTCPSFLRKGDRLRWSSLPNFTSSNETSLNIWMNWSKHEWGCVPYIQLLADHPYYTAEKTDQELADEYRKIRNKSYEIAQELITRGYTFTNINNVRLLYSDARCCIKKTVTTEISL